MRSRFLGLGLLWLMIWGSPAFPSSLFSNTSNLNRKDPDRSAAIVQIVATPEHLDSLQSGSLFADRERNGLFAPVIRQVPQRVKPLRNMSNVEALRSLIATVEAGRAQYNAVVYSAKIKPSKKPTQMTLAEIYKWIDDTPGQNHAIGRYQFIPSTLRRLVTQLGVKTTARFSPELQDRLSDILLEDAGFTRFRAGELSQVAFMNNLARIWAGLPTSSGKSHYAGVAGNKAGMSWTRFETEMTRIFPPVKADAS
ncbi:MAG: hypothetical protein ABJL99_23375 [Aliishimia sp.]